MKVPTVFLFFLLITSVTLKSQPKQGEPGSEGTYLTLEDFNGTPDSSVLKQGPYEFWYEGVKIISGEYDNNKKDGLWKYSNLTGSFYLEGNYYQNKRSGNWKY